MSALNFFNQGNRGILLQDAATYDRNGIILELGRKGCIIPQFNAFMATTGQRRTAAFFAVYLPALFSDIDDLSLQAEEHFAISGPTLIREFAAHGKPSFNILVAAWSPAQQRVLAVSVGTGQGDGETVQVVNDVGWSISPRMEGEAGERLKSIMEGGTQGIDPIKFGIPLMEIQRTYKTPATDWIPDSYVVGGHISSTIIDESGITTEIVHHWPDDRVGERIVHKPTFSVVGSAPAPVISRQQRRALARQAA